MKPAGFTLRRAALDEVSHELTLEFFVFVEPVRASDCSCFSDELVSR